MRPPPASNLALISIPSLSHHPLVLVGLNQILPEITPTRPSYFRFPDIQLWSRLHKVQSLLLQVRGFLPLPYIAPLNLLGTVPQGTCQILDVPQGPLIPLPHTHHILLRILSTKSLISTLPHISFSSKSHPSFTNHLLGTFPPFTQ